MKLLTPGETIALGERFYAFLPLLHEVAVEANIVSLQFNYGDDAREFSAFLEKELAP